jgi:hypothetical protein
MKPPHLWGGSSPLRLADLSAYATIVDDDLQGGALPNCHVSVLSDRNTASSSPTADE